MKMKIYREIKNNISVLLILFSSSFCISILFKNTIALRNISLFIGGFIGIFYLYQNFKNHIFSTKSLIIYFLIFLWILIQFFIVETNYSLQISEITSLWPRCLFSSILGLSLGFVLRRDKKINLIILLSLFSSLPLYLIYLFSAYVFYSDLEFPYYGFFATKASGAYFILISLFLSLSLLDFFYNKKRFFIFLLPIIFLLYAFTFFYLSSFNGLIILVLLITIFILKSYKKSFYGNKNTILCIVLILIISGYLSYIKFAQIDSRINTLYRDITIATKTEQYTHWRMDEVLPGFPSPGYLILDDGHRVNFSTYIRIASFKVGLNYLLNNPLGTGFTISSYGYYLKSEFPHSNLTHTHSGWLDLALGIGLPGIILIFFLLLLNILKTIKLLKLKIYNNFWPYFSFWMILGLFLAWLFIEIGEKEYIEQLFFFLSLFSSLLNFREQSIANEYKHSNVIT